VIRGIGRILERHKIKRKSFMENPNAGFEAIRKVTRISWLLDTLGVDTPQAREPAIAPRGERA
jgi:hypothetical protein